MVRISAPAGEPYLNAIKRVDWAKGVLEQTIDVAPEKGVVIHGLEDRCRLQQAGRRRNGPFFLPVPVPKGTQPKQRHGVDDCDERGRTFQIVSPPVRGHLIVLGPTDDYVLHRMDDRTLCDEGTPGSRMFAHAFEVLVREWRQRHPAGRCRAEACRNDQGGVIGVDGQPVHDAWMLSRIIVNSGSLSQWSGGVHGRVWDGRSYSSSALRTRGSGVFLDPMAKRGRRSTLSGNSTRCDRSRSPRALRRGEGTANRFGRKSWRISTGSVCHRDGCHARSNTRVQVPSPGSRSPTKAL